MSNYSTVSTNSMLLDSPVVIHLQTATDSGDNLSLGVSLLSLSVIILASSSRGTRRITSCWPEHQPLITVLSDWVRSPKTSSMKHWNVLGLFLSRFGIQRIQKVPMIFWMWSSQFPSSPSQSGNTYWPNPGINISRSSLKFLKSLIYWEVRRSLGLSWHYVVFS